VRILWVKADKLLPVQSGGNIRSYNILRQLAAHHEITFFSYYDGERDVRYERVLQEEFPNAVCLSTGRPDVTGWRRALDYLVYFPGCDPYAVARFSSAGVRRRLHQWYSDRPFDAVVCDFLDAAVNLPRRLTIPTILFQHNVESEIWRRHSLTAPRWTKRLMYSVEFRKMVRYERAMVQKVHHVIAVSNRDRELMSAWMDASRITVVPTGVDLRRFAPETPPRNIGPLLVFVGAMDWEPNIDAVEYFCKEILHRVLAEVPEARFRIVGRNPDSRVHKLASSSVEVTGSVPSVVDHLREAAVVVVPLRIGGGTRLKIYEAMAMGKAVVSTSVGAEGLDIGQERNLILADDAPAFAKAIQLLLQDPESRCRYERAAAQHAARFDWSVVGEMFSQVLDATAGLPSGEKQACAFVPEG